MKRTQFPKPPWWFCSGWWSPWCILDSVAHKLLPHVGISYLCDKHDAAVARALELA